MAAIPHLHSKIIVLAALLASCMVACNVACRQEGNEMEMKVIIVDREVTKDSIWEVVCYLDPAELQKNEITEVEIQEALHRLIQLTNGLVDDETDKRVYESGMLDNPGIKKLLECGVFASLFAVHEARRDLACRYVIRFPDPRHRNAGENEIRVKRE